MKNININQTIRLFSTCSRHLVIVAIGILSAKICWWLANPLGYDSLSSITFNPLISEEISSDISNRAPFGVYVEIKAPPPTIKDIVKVVGVYAGDKQNSIAFISMNEKTTLAKIGDKVSDTTLVEILATGAVFKANDGQKVTIEITSAGPSSSSNLSSNSSSSSSYQNSSYSPPSSGSNRSSDDDVSEKRRKMIEQFRKENSGK